jgi:hypothetical protein
MAFSLNFLARVELAQNQFDPAYNPATGSATGVAVNMWTYNAGAAAANDTTAATQAADYFLGAKGYLKAGDMIYVSSNNPGFHILNVAVNNGVTVTTAQIV